MSDESPLKFPCDFPIKAFALVADDTPEIILGLLQKHFSHLTMDDVSIRHSKDKKYLAVTVTVHAESKKQLDDLYIELNNSDHIVMTL